MAQQLAASVEQVISSLEIDRPKVRQAWKEIGYKFCVYWKRGHRGWGARLCQKRE